jgi:hypothetical protein
MEQKNGREMIILKLILERQYSEYELSLSGSRYGALSHSEPRVNPVRMELTTISCKARTEFLSIFQKKFVLPKINSKAGLQFAAPFFTVWMSKRRF